MKRLLLITVIFASQLLLFQQVFGQQQLRQLEITPTEPDGPIPILTNQPEMALLIIRSSLTNLTFSSNFSIVEEQSDPARGEYMLILEPVTQSITVSSRGFMSGQITLRGWSARDVRYYSVEPLIALSESTLPVAVRISPPAAAERTTVLLDGEPVDITRPLELEPDSYAIEMSLPGYRTLRETIEVNREQFVFDFTLQELQEEIITIQTNPAGATVFVDGQEEGATDSEGTLGFFRLPGQYEVRLFLSGYQGLLQTITVVEEGANEFSFDLERNTATLALTVEPENARVTINRQPVDISQPIDLSAGAHRLEISLDGYEPYSENLSAERGQQIERTISLEAHTGGLQFRVNPTFAQVVLRDTDGREIDRWNGIRRIESLPTGFYTVRVEAAGYENQDEEFEITRDEIMQKAIRLQEEQPVAAVRREAVVQPDEKARPQPFPELVPSLPSRSTAVTTSLFVPGGGHIYSGRNRGYLYLAGGLAAGGFAAWTFMQEKSIESDYNNAVQRFSSAESYNDAIQPRNEALRYYNEWNDLIDQRTIALAAFAGIYAIQLVDILTTSPERGYRDSTGSGWQAGTSGAGIRLRYNFN